jgi:cardiolipin synthase
VNRPVAAAGLFRHLPNAITCARIVACLPLVLLIVREQPRAALWLALAVGLSDVLDGFLARRFGWQSRIGSLLDPIADKLFLVCAFIALGVVGLMPVWLIVLVLLRDVVIVAGATAYHHLVEPVAGAPTLLGKASTVAQVLLVLVLLAGPAELLPAPATPLPGLLVGAVAVLAVASALHYAWTWTARARRAWNKDGQ